MTRSGATLGYGTGYCLFRQVLMQTVASLAESSCHEDITVCLGMAQREGMEPATVSSAWS